MVSFPAAAIVIPTAPNPELSRSYLLTFRGRESTKDGFRSKLNALSKESEPDSRIQVIVSDIPSSDYQQEMEDSNFCLIPRGDCLFSYRLLEALAAGCIPVILSDGYVLPFSEVLDWKTFALHLPERDWQSIPQLLRSYDEQAIQKLRLRGRKVWLEWFESIGKQVDGFLRIHYQLSGGLGQTCKEPETCSSTAAGR